MALGNGGDSDGPIAAINVTPLVDVMLVLLVIFMVTAPMMQQGVDVNLPKAASGPVSGSSEQVVVSIDSSGKIYIGAGNEVKPEELALKIKAIFEQRKDEERKVFIKADQALQYGSVMETMASLHQGGITQIGLISSPPEAAATSNRQTKKRK